MLRFGIERVPNRTRGLLAAGSLFLIWSTPALFMHWLTRHYDVVTQNFYRYLAGTLAVLPFALMVGTRRGRITCSTIALCLIPALPNVAHQLAQTGAVSILQPGFYAVFTRMTVVFTALAAMAMFVEERPIIRDPRFLIGTAIGIGGTIGLVALRPGSFTEGTADRTGMWLALGAGLSWALYSVLVKKFASHLDPLTGFSIIGMLTTLLLLPLTVAWGDLPRLTSAGWWPNTVLVFSGVFCIGLGHALFYITIQDLGVAVAQNLQLLCPLGTVLLSTLIFDERLRIAQLLCGAAILSGAFLTVSIDPRRIAPEDND